MRKFEAEKYERFSKNKIKNLFAKAGLSTKISKLNEFTYSVKARVL